MTGDPAAQTEAGPQPVGVRSRLTGLSDHVFGFAATLLAARLVLPAGAAGDGAATALGDRAGTIGLYIFGFLVIGYQWWRHHQVFLRVTRTTNALLWLNLVMLMFVAVMPYTTSVLGESRVHLAVVIYVIPLLASSLVLLVVWEYALRHQLTDDGALTAELGHIRLQLLILPAVLLVSLALLYLAGTGAAIASWMLFPVGLFVAHRLDPVADPVGRPSPFARLRATAGSYIDDGLERVVAYSDGIYAVVLTIIAEQLGGDERRAGVDLTSSQLWEEVSSQQETFIAFGLTFFTVGLFWTIHAEVFGGIVRLRTPLLWLALVHLMVIALQPFGLSVFTDFGSADSTQATAVYLSFILAASLTLSAVGIYADWGNRCVLPGTTADERRANQLRSASAAAIFITAIIVAVMTNDANSGWAFAAFLFFPLTDRLIDRRYGNPTSAVVVPTVRR